MKITFVTHFYGNYLPYFMALYYSMDRNIDHFKIYVGALDDTVYEFLTNFDARVIPIKLEDFAHKDLLDLKNTRTIGEFCWTITPFVADLAFKNDDCTHVTYIDTDLWFNRSPYYIYEEFFKSQKSCLITKHAYHPEYDQSISSGIYCVQFIVFDRFKSKSLREAWGKQCLEWCFDRCEDGKFGDQMYLNKWPYQYPNEVHVLREESRIMGPWSANRFPHSDADVWHFHGLRLSITNDKKLVVNRDKYYRIPDNTLSAIYHPYINDLNNGLKFLNARGLNIYELLNKNEKDNNTN